MKKQGRELFVVGVVLLLIAGACAAPVPPTPTPMPPTSTLVLPTPTLAPPTLTPTPSPPDLVKTFQDTFNKRDTEGLLAMFTDNPVWGFGFSATGLKAVRNNVEYMFEVNTVFEFSDCKLNKSAVACQATLTNDCWGVYVPRYDVTFGFKEGRIAAFGGSLNNSAELAAIPTAPPPSVTWLDWARQNLPDDFAKYSDNEWAKFSGTGDQASGKLSAREFGQVVDRMCKGYAEAMK